MPSRRRISSRCARMPTCLVGWAEAGLDDRNCQLTSRPPSSGTCARSTARPARRGYRASRPRERRGGDRGSVRQASPDITGINIIVAAGVVAAIGDIRRFSSPQKLVSYVGLNPRVRQSGLGLAQHGRISKQAVPCWSRRPGAASKAPRLLRSLFLPIRARRGHRSQRSPCPVSSPCSAGICRPKTKDTDYQWARPALVAHKIRPMQLQAG